MCEVGINGGKRVCERCGAPLVSIRGGRKYCPDCQEVKQLEAKHRRSEKQRGVNSEAAPSRRAKKRPADHKMTIDEVVREAAKLGMSYGEYVAKFDARKEPGK